MDKIFNEDFLIRTSDYSSAMNGTVLPWLESAGKVSILPGYGEKPLYCISYEADDPVGTVLILHGFTENAYKYAELIYSLLHLHFSVIAYDQRGHGRSWRDGDISDASVTHVDHFSEYVEDLNLVCEEYLPSLRRPFMLFAHSMGGAVASLFLEQYGNIFDAAALSSPMIAPYTGGVPAFFATLLADGAQLLGRQKSNPFFMKPYSGPEDFDSSCASDPVRFAWYDGVKAAHKEFQNSVPSYRWSCEAIHVTGKILAKGAPEKISCPVLLSSAESDSSVLPGPQKLFIDRVPRGKQILVQGAKHEIFRSPNDVLFPWWHTVIHFFMKQTGPDCPEL